MKSTDLRIGNYVLDLFDPKNPKETQIGLDDFAVMSNYIRSNHPIPYKPILITEKWLHSFSFINGGLQIGLSQNLELDKDGDHYNVFINQIDSENKHSKILLDLEIKYIHELQNLFYGLTGSELCLV